MFNPPMWRCDVLDARAGDLGGSQVDAVVAGRMESEILHGRELAKLVVAPEVIGSTLASLLHDAIGPALEVLRPDDVPWLDRDDIVEADVRGTATVRSIVDLDGPVAPGHHQQEVWLTLKLNVTLSTKLINEEYDVTSSFRMRLTSWVEPPLVLVLKIDPPTSEDIEVTVSAHGLTNLAESVGGLEGRARHSAMAIAEEIAHGGESPRRLDAVALLRAAMMSIRNPESDGGSEHDLRPGLAIDLSEVTPSSIADVTFDLEPLQPRRN